MRDMESGSPGEAVGWGDLGLISTDEAIKPLEVINAEQLLTRDLPWSEEQGPV